MSKKIRYTRHISTEGNLGFVASGTALYSEYEDNGTIIKKYNVPPKALAMWIETKDGSIPTTIEPADLTTANQISKLKIGVGYSSMNKKISDGIRELVPLQIDGCRIDTLNAFGPKCAVPHIEAIYPGCLSCETLTARYRIYDNDTLSWVGATHVNKQFEQRVVSYTPDCETCDGCDQTVSCDEMVCGLVDLLNNDSQHYLKDGTIYPHTSPQGWGTDVPVKFVKINPNFKAYCIAPEVGTDCTDCNAFAKLTTFTVNNTQYTFNLTDPADDTKTLVDQLELAAMEIEKAFKAELGKHSGFAVVTRGQGQCCPAQLFVSTCDDTFTITGLTECSDAITSFPDFVTASTCQQCGSSGTTETPNCGIAAIALQPKYDCEELDITQPKQFWGRRVELEIISPSGVLNPKWSKKATLLEPKLPANFGSQIQFAEFNNVYEELGDFGDIGDHRSGWLGLPSKQSKLRKAVRARCDKSYCTYQIGFSTFDKFGITGMGTYQSFGIEGNIDVPENDSTTKTAVEALLTKLKTLSPESCEVITAINCAGDQI